MDLDSSDGCVKFSFSSHQISVYMYVHICTHMQIPVTKWVLQAQLDAEVQMVS